MHAKERENHLAELIQQQEKHKQELNAVKTTLEKEKVKYDVENQSLKNLNKQLNDIVEQQKNELQASDKKSYSLLQDQVQDNTKTEELYQKLNRYVAQVEELKIKN